MPKEKNSKDAAAKKARKAEKQNKNATKAKQKEKKTKAKRKDAESDDDNVDLDAVLAEYAKQVCLWFYFETLSILASLSLACLPNAFLGLEG